MSLYFDGASSYAKFDDDAALTLPDGDWSISFWFKSDNLAGNSYRHLLAWGAGWGLTPGFHSIVYEDSEASPGICRGNVRDADADNVWLTGAVDRGDDTWHHMLVYRASGVFYQRVDDTAEGSAAGAAIDAINVADELFFGALLGTSRFFSGWIAEVAKWDRVMTSGEMTALAGGAPPSDFPADLAWYWRMLDPSDNNELVAGLTVTQVATAGGDHPLAVGGGGSRSRRRRRHLHMQGRI